MYETIDLNKFVKEKQHLQVKIPLQIFHKQLVSYYYSAQTIFLHSTFSMNNQYRFDLKDLTSYQFIFLTPHIQLYITYLLVLVLGQIQKLKLCICIPSH